jgi:hypothetical protein
MNKILTLSVWGDNPRYILGAKRQVDLAKKFYPDFRCRIYTDNPKNFIEDDADIVHIEGNYKGYFWRFRALFEDENNIVLVRDADGRITIREEMAVREWLESNENFHTFRDHEAHFQFPIIACAFGYKGMLSEDLKNKMTFFEQNTDFYTNDQVYLRDHVWPAVRNDALIHSMHEGWFKYTRSKLLNPYSFCGNGYDEHDMPLYPDTLAACANFDNTKISRDFKFDKGILHG